MSATPSLAASSPEMRQRLLLTLLEAWIPPEDIAAHVLARNTDAHLRREPLVRFPAAKGKGLWEFPDLFFNRERERIGRPRAPRRRPTQRSGRGAGPRSLATSFFYLRSSAYFIASSQARNCAESPPTRDTAQRESVSGPSLRASGNYEEP
jgi:hypothetical protein